MTGRHARRRITLLQGVLIALLTMAAAGTAGYWAYATLMSGPVVAHGDIGGGP